MIKLERQFRLTINDRTIDTDNPKQALWSNLFCTTNDKYESEFIDAFLEEVMHELETIQTLKDKSPEEAFFQFLDGSPESKSFMAWVYMSNCGLATRKNNKLLLTENGEDLLKILINLLGKKENGDSSTGSGSNGPNIDGEEVEL